MLWSLACIIWCKLALALSFTFSCGTLEDDLRKKEVLYCNNVKLVINTHDTASQNSGTSADYKSLYRNIIPQKIQYSISMKSESPPKPAQYILAVPGIPGMVTLSCVIIILFLGVPLYYTLTY